MSFPDGIYSIIFDNDGEEAVLRYSSITGGYALETEEASYDHESIRELRHRLTAVPGARFEFVISFVDRTSIAGVCSRDDGWLFDIWAFAASLAVLPDEVQAFLDNTPRTTAGMRVNQDPVPLDVLTDFAVRVNGDARPVMTAIERIRAMWAEWTADDHE